MQKQPTLGDGPVAKCEHFEVCGRDALKGQELCILHSLKPGKSQQAFKAALAEHRSRKNDCDFSRFVFPGNADFNGAIFNEWGTFFHCVFTETADFAHAKFRKGADFSAAKFHGDATFFNATFTGGSKFSGAEFTLWARFTLAIFRDWVWFDKTTFSQSASFREAQFMDSPDFLNTRFLGESAFTSAKFFKGADFSGTQFCKPVEFLWAEFLGRTLFLSREADGHIIPMFSGTVASFREVAIAPLDVLAFRDADLQKCFFVGTDVRKAEFANVIWPKMGSRLGVFDEIDAEEKKQTHNYPHIEQLYRQLKQNYEDRRDYERASDFHFGEKEMRRRNKNISWGLWFWLTMYWLISGYGERWIRPLLWTAGVLLASTLSYLGWGLLRVRDTGPVVDWSRTWESGLYSLRVMTLLKPTNFEPIGLGGDLIYTLQSIFGPLLIGLFALAVRQRLKR